MAVTIKGFASDWSVPAGAKARLDELFPPRDPHAINARELGAIGDNTTTNTEFLTAVQQAKAGRRNNPAAPTGDKYGTKTIDIPAGDYRITDIMGLLGKEEQSVKVTGLRVRGAGISLTHIIFDPAEAGALMFNNYWMNIAFEGMTFRTTVAGSTFMQSYTTNSAQKYTFTDVNWIGPWKYIFDLQGNDNNSEFSFYGCETSGMADDGAFLYIGATNTSDQFLNYWFFGFKHWSTSASLIDAARGGHFHLYGVDASDWAIGLAAPRYLINLRGNTHSQGTCTMTTSGFRVEAKSQHAGLIYSEWPEGNVDIQCDWSSQSSFTTYNDIIHLNLGNIGGAVYNFHDSHLAGGVRITYGVDAWRAQHSVSFQNCGWQQRLTPSEVVSYVDPASNTIRPQVAFRRCRGGTQSPSTATAGATVWDATVSYNRGASIKPLEKRALGISHTTGNLSGTSAVKLNLPVGATLTGVRAVAPPIATASSNGGSWTIEDADGNVLGSVTVSTPLRDGYNVSTEFTVPVLCDTRNKATLTVRASGVATSNSGAFLSVEGYW